MNPPRFSAGHTVFVGSDGGELPRGTELVIEIVKQRPGGAGWRYWVVPTGHIGADGRLWMDEEMLSAEKPRAHQNEAVLTLDERAVLQGWLIEAAGVVDMKTAPQLLAAVTAGIQATGAVRLILDLRQTDYLDSSGLSLMVATMRLLHDQGRPLWALMTSGSQPERVMRLANMGSVMHVAHTLEEIA